VKRFISALLIAAFGLSLVADAVFAETHAEHDSLAITSSCATNLDGEHSIVVVDSYRVPPLQKANCADPCHAGVTHFGHGAMVLSSNSVPFQGDIKIGFGPFEHAVIASPDLEGLRRPPRLA
jgi:hypothetical protein